MYISLTGKPQNGLKSGSLWPLLLAPRIMRTAFFCKINILLMYEAQVEPPRWTE